MENSFNLNKLNTDYSKHKESSFSRKKIKHSVVEKLCSEKCKSDKLKLSIAGHSIENRSINQISFGNGPVNVLCWSQIHGNESTATMAVFDVLNFLISEENESAINYLSEKLTIHFIPMLNPDGAEKFVRENAVDIDLNRDALRLVSPESKILKRAILDLKPKFGFNLHDQKKYYSAGYCSNPAAISFLAPAFNYEKEINEVRERAIKLITELNESISSIIPNCVGRYDDEFEKRAFGDNIMKWNTSTVLIESGGYKDDTEKQFLRKINYLLLLTSFYSIASGNYEKFEVEKYYSIPENRERLFDLIIRNATVKQNDELYQIDIGINRTEFYENGSDRICYESTIENIGDLSTFYAYEEFDAENLITDEALFFDSVTDSQIKTHIRDGYLYFKKNENSKAVNLPANIYNSNKPDSQIALESNANFYLSDNKGNKKFAVINGFLVDLIDENFEIPNCINFF